MPRKKVTRPIHQKEEISYETKIIIVVLLLLFVYPVGLIVMWWWMQDWPIVVKILLSIPLFIAIAMLFGFIALISIFLHRTNTPNLRQLDRQERFEERRMIFSTPTPTAITPTETPTSTTF